MEQSINNNTLFRVNGLSHSFGGLKAVSNFNLAVESGSIWGILGPNGAGKTTIFNLITGVYKPDEGEVFLQGETITALPSHEIIARGVARTFQNIRLFKSMTVLDNVRTSAYSHLRYTLWSALLRTPHFHKMEDHVLQSSIAVLEKFGLAERMSEQAASLPYGLQRKIELARALLSRPLLLLLDEPGAGMNPSELHDLADLILWVRQEFGVTIILIEHRMQLVMKLCERVKVLDFGETIFEGRTDELGSSEAVVKAYFGEDHADARH
jgi:branched-chain amino acid transport system ATP-binding protein